MYKDGNTTYELTRGNYIDVLSKAFADVPEFVKRVRHREFKFRELSQIFEQYRHARSKHNDEPITIKLDSAG
jgi:hypothetical protein